MRWEFSLIGGAVVFVLTVIVTNIPEPLPPAPRPMADPKGVRESHSRVDLSASPSAPARPALTPIEIASEVSQETKPVTDPPPERDLPSQRAIPLLRSGQSPVLPPKPLDPSVPNYGRLIVDPHDPKREVGRLLSLYDEALSRRRFSERDQTLADGNGFDTSTCAQALADLVLMHHEHYSEVTDHAGKLTNWNDMAPLAAALGAIGPVDPDAAHSLRNSFWVENPDRQRLTLTLLSRDPSPATLELSEAASFRRGSPEVQRAGISNLDFALRGDFLKPERRLRLLTSLQALGSDEREDGGVRADALRTWGQVSRSEEDRAFLRRRSTEDPSEEVRATAQQVLRQ
ncbi:MAG: hypothetical protein HYY93_05750 [Planctomycetes bacterium]|nr:hypothetical protein [Planctomycetota bacterium]